MVKTTKRLILLTIILILVALFFVACNDDPGTPTPTKGEWKSIKEKDLSAVTAYSHLLTSAFNIAGSFTENALSSNPRVHIDGKLKLEVNGTKFLVHILANYDDNDKKNAMLSLVLSDKDGTSEVIYENMQVGVFLYKEMFYVAIGDTKFSGKMSVDVWDDIFPLTSELLSGNHSKTVNDLSTFLNGIVVLENNYLKGWEKLDGVNTQYKYELKVNLQQTIDKLLKAIKNPLGLFTTTPEMVAELERFIANLFGISVEDVSTNFPRSTVMMNYVIESGILTDLNLDVYIERPEGETVFNDDLDLSVNIESLNIKKGGKNNQTIFGSFPFAGDKTGRASYENYLNRIFYFKNEIVAAGSAPQKKYDLTVIAKVFQENTIDNYLFIEITDKTTSQIVHSAYFIQNMVYVDSYMTDSSPIAIECPLGGMATVLVDNDYEGAKEANIFNILTYFIGAVSFEDNNITIYNSQRFIEEAWRNYGAFFDYLNGLYEEDILELPSVSGILDFIFNAPYNITFKDDYKFIRSLSENSSEIIAIKNKILAFYPETTIYLRQEQEQGQEQEQE